MTNFSWFYTSSQHFQCVFIKLLNNQKLINYCSLVIAHCYSAQAFPSPYKRGSTVLLNCNCQHALYKVSSTIKLHIQPFSFVLLQFSCDLLQQLARTICVSF